MKNFKTYLEEAVRVQPNPERFPEVNRKATLSSSIKKKIMKDMGKFLKPIYFNFIPLGDIMDITEKYGVVVVDDSESTRWQGFLIGKEGTEYFTLADANTTVQYGKAVIYTKVFRNGMLALQWYKMPSGKYEITSYVS